MKKMITKVLACILAGSMIFSMAAMAEGTEEKAYLEFESAEVTVTDGSVSWNPETKEWTAVMPSMYGEVILSGVYDEDGVLEVTEDSTGGFATADLPFIQEVFKEAFAGKRTAPLSFSSEEAEVSGGKLSWDETVREWTAVMPSMYGEVTLSGIYDEDGVLEVTEDSTGGFATADLPFIQEVFTDAVAGTFQKAVVKEGVADNALSEALEARDDIENQWKSTVVDIARTYDPVVRNQDIIFYGASNFAYWETMEEDLAPFDVQNHAFGGSTDKDLELFAEYMLYPYEPQFVFFQTGSNDYVESQAETDELKVAEAMEFKKAMFEEFHEALPDATFIVMSGILLPGRAEYVDMTLDINDQLREFCDETDYMIFVDAEELTYNREAGEFVDNVEDMFNNDQIHLTGDSRIIWAQNWILPIMEELNMPKTEE